MISDDAIASYAATSGVHLDPEQVSILQQIRRTAQPLFCIKALARAS